MERPPYSRRKRHQPNRPQPTPEYWRSRQSLQKFVQAIPVPIFVTTPADGRILAANRKFLELLGYESVQLIGRSFAELDLLPPGPAYPDLIRRLKAAPEGEDREIHLRDRRGQDITALVSVESFLLHGQECLLISLVDLSNRKRIEEMLRARYDLLLTTGQISTSLAAVQELPQIYQRLAETIRQLIPQAAEISIRLYDTRTRALATVFSTCQMELQPAWAPCESPVRGAGRGGLAPARPPRNQAAATLTQVVLPLAAKGEALGLLEVSAPDENGFSEADLALVSWLGNTAAVAIQNARLIQNLQKTHEDLDRAYEATLEGWSRALELRDHETQGHTERVVRAAVELAEAMGINGRELENIRRGAQLHDIGKMGIPDHILLKPGPLTEQEWAVMRKHPVYAYEMLSPIPQFREILDIPYAHHEKWDGSGYPRRLKSEHIPLGARVFAVVDVWDALSSDRPYRAAWPESLVFDYLRYESGRHFDPRMVERFLTLRA